MTRKVTRGLAAVAAAALVAQVLALAGPAAHAATGDITAFGASTSGLFPTGGIIEGPDGHVYFANPWGSGATNGIGEITPSGTITFHTHANIDGPADLTVGGDGNLWFTDPGGGSGTGQIGRFNPTTEVFTFFSSGSVVFPFKIATAPDGSIWFNGGGSVAQRMHTGGTGTAGSLSVQTSTGGTTGDIARGPDGNMWITKSNGNHELLRVDPVTGATQAFDIPQGDVGPRQLTIGPDGNLWFTHTGFAQPGVMRYVIGTNTFTNFPIPAGSNPKGITAGDDGYLWFIRGNTGTVARISTAGTGYTTYTASGLQFGPSPHEIAPGPGNTLWAAAGGNSSRRIARVAVDPPSCDGQAITVDLNDGDTPTNGDDVILGTPNPDTINGLGGNDRICGGDRGDTINGGPGDDRIFGFKGSDTLSGGTENDRLVGGKGTDVCNGDAGTDTNQTCETRTGFP